MKFAKAKATILAALFILMQLVAPPGMMVSGGEDGFEIVICSSQGMKTILIDENGNELPQVDKASDSNCGFAHSVAKAIKVSPETTFARSGVSSLSVSIPQSVTLFETTLRTGAPRAPPV
ncbi:DUF2946 family protein [Pseudovibrio sp. Tun.PSC04-5.I4]|uniref:DUF2946 family protein n=1 Tax=Pseudovibrio sp. Tun.PSC04-5.I4 TaxID=1798213 RepID=UPI00087DF858|nr:DUF2946 family protein [Pseudovibrio sp. Tun.PSC04-5.I4]SDQ12774.1 hypothetical protein SAMN04515695_0060 [Pseudovibrio sp. Tun.PSC04-5.I4]